MLLGYLAIVGIDLIGGRKDVGNMRRSQINHNPIC